jgi:hypothetical protein
MITGVDKSLTGSYDAYFDTAGPPMAYAYLGINVGQTSSFFTWNKASRETSSLSDLQMYTPYPTGSERGKLYWVSSSAWNSDTGIPNRSSYVELFQPAGDAYYIITPSLNTSSLAGGRHIAQYAFADEDDLFDNGWKSQRGTTDASNALATSASWYDLVNDPLWTAPPLNLNPLATAGDKAQIVANLLAYTETSYQVQNTLGLSGSNLIKGAIVLAGESSPFNNTTYQGLVPLLG